MFSIWQPILNYYHGNWCDIFLYELIVPLSVNNVIFCHKLNQRNSGPVNAHIIPGIYLNTVLYAHIKEQGQNIR